MTSTYKLPGDITFNPELVNQLNQKKSDSSASYLPRTHHLDSDGWAVYTNRLFLESSPYLLQHAHNPVNWFPWGDEAFEEARRLDRPVLVSIGYSTCHWCHVMEDESFEDEEIAGYLNQNYVAIKVDREERPDVDSVYMSAIQLLNGNGGWPLNVWLTPDKKPFWGGTYFPARDGDRGGSTGFLTILNKLAHLYGEDREAILRSGQSLQDAIQKSLNPEGGQNLPGREMIEDAIDHFKKNFDGTNGGLLGAPKFPSSLPLRLLLRHHHQTGDQKCLSMAEKTLTTLFEGGIHDHVGGGFHRYSVDEKWHVPHFEKMLYDNALLAVAYLEGYQQTSNPLFKLAVEDILRFVGRDLLSPDGAFFSAIDADSLTADGRREEGFYFTWPYTELRDVLSGEEFALIRTVYDPSEPGNFEGRNIPLNSRALETILQELNTDIEALEKRLAPVKAKLLAVRNDRSLPITDTKTLTGWNGLMISAFAKAGFILDNTSYTQTAATAAACIREALFVDGQLYRCVSAGKPKIKAFLEDYAYYIAGLIDLFESTHQIEWLELALELEQIVNEEFEDSASGGFFAVSKTQTDLIAREKPYYDGATPSGNSVALSNLLRLGAYTGKPEFIHRFEGGVKGLLGGSYGNPIAVTELLLAIDAYHDNPLEIALLFPADPRPEDKGFLDELRTRYLPNKSLVITTSDATLERAAKSVGYLRHKQLIDGKTTAYICEAGACQTPTTLLREFSSQLKKG